MKKLLLIIIFLYQGESSAQSPYVLDNIFGLNLKFKMSEDSIQNMYKIKCGDLLDSSTISINGITWNIDRYVKYNMGCLYRDKIYTFLQTNNFPDSLFAVLDFYTGKLIQVTIYFKGDKRTSDVKKEIMRYFKLKQFSYKAHDKTTKALFQLNKNGYNYLIISDKKALELVPPWCGNNPRKGSWPKLEKYLSKKE